MTELRHYVDDNLAPRTAAEVYANRVPSVLPTEAPAATKRSN
jgi:hypothetical protein